jgi:hypothetical protein
MLPRADFETSDYYDFRMNGRAQPCIPRWVINGKQYYTLEFGINPEEKQERDEEKPVLFLHSKHAMEFT